MSAREWQIVFGAIAALMAAGVLFWALAKSLVASFFKRMEDRFQDIHKHSGDLADHERRIVWLEKAQIESQVHLSKQVEALDKKTDDTAIRIARIETGLDIVGQLRGAILQDRRSGD